MNQSQKAAHLDLSTRNLRELFARGELDKTADIDALRVAYIRRLRAVTANRAPNGPLDPQQEKARLDKLRADQIADRIALERGPASSRCRRRACVG
ncbi:MAG: hypothetical protein WBG92_14960 [Thiohalocapsa sp.]